MRDANNNQCRWVDGYIGRDPQCCGEDTHKHSSWCKDHYSKVFREDAVRSKVRFNIGPKPINVSRNKKC